MEIAECEQYINEHVVATLKDGAVKHWYILGIMDAIDNDVGDDPYTTNKDVVIYWLSQSKNQMGGLTMAGEGYPCEDIISMEIEDKVQ